MGSGGTASGSGASGRAASPRRGLVVAIAELAVGAAIVLLSTQPTWLHVQVPGTTGGTALAVEVSGSQAAPVLVALGLLSLAGVVGLVATRGGVRRVVGLLLFLSAAAALVAVLKVVGDPAAAAAGALRAESVDAAAASSATYSLTGWHWVTVVGTALVAWAGADTLWRSAAWPAMGARYEAPAGDRREPAADPWTALDRGEDPTVPE
jgi:uncharacterized membrane protein (TIGR02234 family)